MHGWLVVLGFNATLTAIVISWQSVTHVCSLAFSHQYQHNFSFQSHRLLFSHASVADKRQKYATKCIEMRDCGIVHKEITTSSSDHVYIHAQYPLTL